MSDSPDIRKTHPNLWRAVMFTSGVFLALSVNFYFATPTFLIFQASNDVWAAAFATFGLASIIFLNVYRSLALLRATMALTVAYLLILAAGTSEPFIHGIGSLQLPILYVGLAAMYFPLLLEPFLNPQTAVDD